MQRAQRNLRPADSDTHDYVDKYAHADTDRDTDSNADAYADGDIDANAHRYTDRHAHGHANRDADADTHSDTDTDQYRNPDSHAQRRDGLLSVRRHVSIMWATGRWCVRHRVQSGFQRSVSGLWKLCDIHTVSDEYRNAHLDRVGNGDRDTKSIANCQPHLDALRHLDSDADADRHAHECRDTNPHARTERLLSV